MNMQHKMTGSKLRYRPMIEAELSDSERNRAFDRSTRMGRIARITAAKLHAASMTITERMPKMANWYCLRVEPNKEFTVEKSLKEANVEVCMPCERVGSVRKGQIVETVRLLFPSYILVRCVPSDEAFHGLKSVRHVMDIVGSTAGYYVVRNADVEALQKVRDEGDAPRVATDKTMKDGDAAMITFGPFSGLRCVVIAVKWCRQARAKVVIDVMGKPFEICSIPIAFLKKS